MVFHKPAARRQQSRATPSDASTCFWDCSLQGHSHPRDLPPRPPKEGSRSACLGAFICLPFPLPQEALSHHRPASLQPGFLLHPARFTLLFPPPLPLPHCCQPMFAFLSPAVLPLPSPPRPALAPYSILPERLRPEPKLASVR